MMKKMKRGDSGGADSKGGHERPLEEERCELRLKGGGGTQINRTDFSICLRRSVGQHGTVIQISPLLKLLIPYLS